MAIEFARKPLPRTQIQELRAFVEDGTIRWPRSVSFETDLVQFMGGRPFPLIDRIDGVPSWMTRTGLHLSGTAPDDQQNIALTITAEI